MTFGSFISLSEFSIDVVIVHAVDRSVEVVVEPLGGVDVPAVVGVGVHAWFQFFIF